MKNLPDVQNTCKEGFPKIGIEKIGVRHLFLRLPITQKNGSTQIVLADISSYVNLAKDVKGANLSRFSRTIIDELWKDSSNDGIYDLSNFTYKLRDANDNSDDVYVKAKFTYMIILESPITKLASPEPVECVFESTLKKGVLKNYLTIKTNESSACCCSYEMSKLVNNLTAKEANELNDISPELAEKIEMATLGVHNQRSVIEIKVELLGKDKMWIEDLLQYAKLGASSPTFNVLKRPDEKYVSEVMVTGKYIDEQFKVVDTPYKGVAFAEDIGRNIAEYLNTELDNRINDWVVVINNQESIHTTLLATSILTAGRMLV